MLKWLAYEERFQMKRPDKKKRKRTSNGQAPLPRIDVTTMYDTLTLEDYKRLRG